MKAESLIARHGPGSQQTAFPYSQDLGGFFEDAAKFLHTAA